MRRSRDDLLRNRRLRHEHPGHVAGRQCVTRLRWPCPQLRDQAEANEAGCGAHHPLRSAWQLLRRLWCAGLRQGEGHHGYAVRVQAAVGQACGRRPCEVVGDGDNGLQWAGGSRAVRRRRGSPMQPLRMSRRVMNLAHMLTQNARRHGARPGFVWGDRSWTWREIAAQLSALAAALAARGIGKGDRILVHSKNGDEMFFSMFAAFRLGAVWVPTNFRLMPDEVIWLATASGAKAFLCHGDFPDHAATVQASSPALNFIWRIGEGTLGEKSVEDIIAAHSGDRIEETSVEYDDPCWLFFTSGTTGRSKAAVLTHGQMAFVITNHLADLMPGTTENDASLVVAPLSHGAG